MASFYAGLISVYHASDLWMPIWHCQRCCRLNWLDLVRLIRIAQKFSWNFKLLICVAVFYSNNLVNKHPKWLLAIRLAHQRFQIVNIVYQAIQLRDSLTNFILQTVAKKVQNLNFFKDRAGNTMRFRVWTLKVPTNERTLLKECIIRGSTGR